jgi:RNA methyltransferase, TrmH family
MSPATHELVFGLRAATAALVHRPNDVRAIVCTAQGEASLLAAVAAETTVATIPNNKDAPRALPVPKRIATRDLDRMTDSQLHEGVALEMAPRSTVKASDLVKSAGPNDLWIALDRVRNPYNIGAILRTAAFFGLPVVLLGAQVRGPTLDPLAVRVAEGGAEHVALSLTTDLAATLAKLRESGFLVLGADVHASATRVPTSRRGSGKRVLVVGHEREGLSERVLAQCTDRVTLLGSGRVESLNVGVAAGILIAQLLGL